MDSVPSPDERPQDTAPHSHGPPDLYDHFAGSNRARVTTRRVTLKQSASAFNTWLRAAVAHHALFPAITYAAARYSLLSYVTEEAGTGVWYGGSEYVGLPALEPGWIRRHIRAVAVNAPDMLVCLFMLRPSAAGGLTGEIVYLDGFEPWIEALLRDGGATWREVEPGAAPIGNGSALGSDRAIQQCPSCTEYERAVIAWAEARVGSPTEGAAPTWEDIADPLLTGGETLRKRCRRHAA